MEQEKNRSPKRTGTKTALVSGCAGLAVLFLLSVFALLLITGGASAIVEQFTEANPPEYFHAVKLNGYIERGNIKKAVRIVKRDPESLTRYMYFWENRHLVSGGENPKWAERPLDVAVMSGYLELVKALVEAADEVKFDDQTHALTYALRYKKGEWVEVAKYLFGQGAGIPTDVSDRITGFEFIAKDSEYEVDVNDQIQAFLWFAENAEHTEADIFLALEQCVYSENILLMEAILDNGLLDVNAVDRAGATALIVAAYGGHIKSAECLISRGADISAATVSGNTAYDIALKHGHTEFAELVKP